MRRGPRIREGRLKVLEELNHLVPASQDPRLGPGRRQSILELIGERGVGGFHIARVPGSVPLLKTLSERAKELGLSSWHSPAQYLAEGSTFHAEEQPRAHRLRCSRARRAKLRLVVP